jgi:sphingomyelin phosphodiesterase acid-like 3
MMHNSRFSFLASGFLCCALATVPALAQKTATISSETTALMVSDVHFEAFRDPAKTANLLSTPVAGWQAILDSPASPDREARWQAVETSCHTRGQDTDEALFNSSLQTIASQAGSSGFATVSGDLLAHAFDCKFHAALPKASDADYRALTEKTIEYVLLRLRQSLPGVPVYAALGNNDSDCGDYQLDENSAFLKDLAPVFVADVPMAERTQAAADFTALGSYRVSLPGSAKGTQVAILDDLFLARKYTACSGKPHPEAGSLLLTWLNQQIDAARQSSRPLWVMGHIPTGVDPYSTVTKMRNVCAGQKPEMFLSSDNLAANMANAGDVIRLAIFSHTHMDEMRLLPPSKENAARGPVAMKLVPSISPINGNHPSFTLARVDATSGILKDYRVVASADEKGSSWAESYDYAKTYGLTDFSAVSATRLIKTLEDDPQAQGAASQAYLQAYYLRGSADLLKLFWPQYVCSLAHPTAEDYRSCICASKNY